MQGNRVGNAIGLNSAEFLTKNHCMTLMSYNNKIAGRLPLMRLNEAREVNLRLNRLKNQADSRCLLCQLEGWQRHTCKRCIAIYIRK